MMRAHVRVMQNARAVADLVCPDLGEHSMCRWSCWLVNSLVVCAALFPSDERRRGAPEAWAEKVLRTS